MIFSIGMCIVILKSKLVDSLLAGRAHLLSQRGVRGNGRIEVWIWYGDSIQLCSMHCNVGILA